MVKFSILGLLYFLITLSLIICDYLGVSEDRIFSIDRDNDLFQFTVKTNQECLLKVHGNPTTGYTWFLSENSDSENLKALNVEKDGSCKNYEVDAHPEEMVGAGGSYYFKLKGLKLGKYQVLLIEKRSWETSIAKEKHVELTVVEN